MENREQYIKGFRDHRGYFDLIDDIKKLIVKSSVNKTYFELYNGVKQLIIETCPYNSKASEKLKELRDKYEELSKFFKDNGKLKAGKENKLEHQRKTKEFINFVEDLRIDIYPLLSSAQVMPYAEKHINSLSELEEDEEKKKELVNLEKVGLV